MLLADRPEQQSDDTGSDAGGDLHWLRILLGQNSKFKLA